jgi:hypothetical protein
MYRLTNSDVILRLADNAFIPANPQLADYQDYLAWLAAGNVPTPLPPEPPPSIVTMRQARLALLAVGLLDEVEAAITDPADRIEWEYATTVVRDSPLVVSLSASLGLDLDALFEMAAEL